MTESVVHALIVSSEPRGCFVSNRFTVVSDNVLSIN